MHDPLTVAFDIKNPFAIRTYGPPDHRSSYHPALITVWHRDPERGGSDDSCDWSGRRRPLNVKERALYEALDDLFHRLGNPPYYPSDVLWGELDEDVRRHGLVPKVEQALYAWKRRSSVRWHPRWHVHHWHIQIHPLQNFKRWAFSRCESCGGRFAWGEAPTSNSWNGTGPRWFKGERGVRHMDCAHQGVDSNEKAVSERIS